MTNKQLNNMVKKFAADLKSEAIEPYSAEAKERFETICGADRSFKAFDADSLRILIVVNRTYRYIAFHLFGPADY